MTLVSTNVFEFNSPVYHRGEGLSLNAGRVDMHWFIGAPLYETGTLSVSVSPLEWTTHAQLHGPIWELARPLPPARFVDLDPIKIAHLPDIINWAHAKGYIDANCNPKPSLLARRFVTALIDDYLIESILITWAEDFSFQLNIQGVWFSDPISSGSAATRGGIFPNSLERFTMRDVTATLKDDPHTLPPVTIQSVEI